MKTYIYPANLKAKAMLGLWTIRDIVILICVTILSVICLVYLRTTLFLAVTVASWIATARVDGQSIADYIKVATRYFLLVPQTYFWRRQHEQKTKH